MKIAITGAMGVGKTTLVEELGKELGWHIIPEVARIMAKRGYKLDGDITEQTEYDMIMMQKELEQKIGPWIADRCIIDICAYCKILFPQSRVLHKMLEREMKAAEYDIILYIPPEFGIVADGTRSTSAEFQRKVDVELKKILREWEHHVVRGSVERRVRKTLNIIENHDRENKKGIRG
jgi:nicotinamide riboside kinase